jgi:splicing factor 3B subunit 1
MSLYLCFSHLPLPLSTSAFPLSPLCPLPLPSPLTDDEIARLQRERQAKMSALQGSQSSSVASARPIPMATSSSAPSRPRAMTSEQIQQQAMRDALNSEESDPLSAHRRETVGDREDDYHSRRIRAVSPDRVDPFADEPDKNPNARSYKDVMQEAQLDRERYHVQRNIQKQQQAAAEAKKHAEEIAAEQGTAVSEQQLSRKRSRRWGSSNVSEEEDDDDDGLNDLGAHPSAHKMAKLSSWDETPVTANGGVSTESKKSSWGSSSSAPKKASRWGMTPDVASGSITPNTSRWGATPSASLKRSRWDQTPDVASGAAGGATPVGNMGLVTPMHPTSGAAAAGGMTPAHISMMRAQQETERRNRPLSDAALNEMLPGPDDGFEIVAPPENYQPTLVNKLEATPTPMTQGMYMLPEEHKETYNLPQAPDDLPFAKAEDFEHFAALLEKKDEDDMSAEESRDRKIMTLLLKVKNGTPPQRKTALRAITNNAREFGAGPLFEQILPLLMSPTIEDQERHLLVKVVDRVLYKLDHLVRPYVHKILIVIEPMLIDEDYYARVEAREIIANLSKAAGLATMIATMRPDIDNVDDYVRNTTARAFAVVASALGIHALLPFLKAVCQSRKSWQARHTGIKIVQQIAILMGCSILPHLKNLVDIVTHGLEDENMKVRQITALALSSLAESSAPYGVESFHAVLKPLWKGILQHRGKTLAAFLKAAGYIIPLMDAQYANYYTREVMVIVIREFASPDDEMKKIVLKVVKQCVSTDGVPPEYVREEIIPEFFKNFWVRRMALDNRNYRQLVETTVELGTKVGGSVIVGRIVDDLKDASEPYRKMVVETIERVLSTLGAADIDAGLETRLVDGMLYAFQEQTGEDTRVMLNGFGVVVNALGIRAKTYIPQICGIIMWRLNNRSAAVRQQAADLISRIAVVMQTCGEMQLLQHLGTVLYESLGEEYPEVLGALLGALKAIVNVVGMEDMKPPIKDLLPRLTPILKNRHEKVQENCIDLVGRIADRGSDYVHIKEWMRISFELLEMLKAHKKGIRRAANNTFGYIAKAIGPHDVLAILLNNLRVQERQSRVCTTVAIAIVAETCAPFTVLPALMNEYRVPDINVQNGVLKALSFLFEYIAEMGKDYVYAVAPLIEDALIDRDAVHRQTACTVVKHLALGVAGLGREDAMLHLLNHVWPNMFEVSPHVINAVMEAIEALRVAVGPTTIMQYCLQGLFHPARKVRKVYWKIYNTLYCGAQDALVPAFPRVPDDSTNSYRRWELEMFL